MRCPTCGQENGTRAIFCQYCGTQLPEGNRATVLPAVKRLFCSPAMLVALIAFTALTAFDVLETVLLMVAGNFFAAAGIRMTDVLLTDIPAVLLVIGSWITYASARNRRTIEMRTTGLSIIKGVAIYYLAVIGTLFALVSIALLLGVISGSPGDVPNDVEEGGAFLWIFTEAIFVFFLFFLIASLIAVNRIKSTIRTGEPPAKFSRVLAVLLFVIGAFASFRVLLLPFYALLGAIDKFILYICEPACIAAMTIALGVFLLRYRERMRVLTWKINHIGLEPSADPDLQSTQAPAPAVTPEVLQPEVTPDLSGDFSDQL